MIVWINGAFGAGKTTAAYGGTVIVPMTLVEPAYYEEIVHRLLTGGVPLCHIILYAKRETILKRLQRRSLGRLSKETFAVEAIDRCLAFFNGLAEGIRIETDGMPVEWIVEKIGEACGLSLLPDDRSRIGREADRLKTLFQHIRR